ARPRGRPKPRPPRRAVPPLPRRLVAHLPRPGSQLGALLRPALITAGHAVTAGDDGSWHVAKKELVSGLQVLLQTRRLQIARALPEADLLVKELQNFRVKVTVAANGVFEAWREGQHDDLVLATALACWWAEQFGYPSYPELIELPHVGRISKRFF